MTPARRITLLSDPEGLPADWEAWVGGRSVVLSRPHLRAMAAAPLPGATLLLALAEEGGKRVGAALFHRVRMRPGLLPRAEAEGPWPVRLFLWALGRWPLWPRHLLICGNLLHADAPGFICAETVADPAALLHELAEAARGDGGAPVGMVMLKTPDLDAQAEQLTGLGYARVDAVEPSMRLEIPTEWTDFDAYVAALRTKYRQRLKAARRKGRGLRRVALDAAGMARHGSALEALMVPVLARADVSLAPLPAASLVALKAELGEALRVVLYRQDGAIVGFAASIHQGDSLDGLWVAADEGVNAPLALYQNALYDFIDEAIRLGCSRLCLGRTALEIKSTVGAAAQPMPVYVRAPGWLLAALLRRAIPRIPPPVWTPRRALHGADGGD